MLKKTFILIFVFAALGCSVKKDRTVSSHKTKISTGEPKLESHQMSSHVELPYCAAIRGNGELAPSHWSALSRIVENLGMPEAMSGGSSATITMFYMESIASNPLISTEPNESFKRQKQGLLLKTIPLYKKALAKYENVNNTYRLLADLKSSSSKVASGLKASFLAAKNRRAIEEAIKKYGYVYNPEFLRNLRINFPFAQQEMRNAVSVFGAFDAVNDENLFFRPGLVDFKYFALMIGQIADFYAGNTSAAVLTEMNSFLNECSAAAFGNIWPRDQDFDCQNKFMQAALKNIKDVYTSENITNFKTDAQIFKKVGSSITSFPTTSVVNDSSYTSYVDKAALYRKGVTTGLKDFHLNPEHIKFGYWGNSENQLAKLHKALKERFPVDLKSQKFLSLGEANWFEVLASSPAEPGLANFQKIMTATDSMSISKELKKGHMTRWDELSYRKDMISAGGWSDLQPTLVLRAHGCENIMYLTLRDGPSLFGQQVFIRLANLTDKVTFWTKLGDHNKQGWDLNVKKNSSAKNTDWDKLYNIKNKNSSHNRSVQEADAAYCTNWNAFNLLKGELNGLWYDAYNSPVILKDGAPLDLKVTDVEPSEATPGCI